MQDFDHESALFTPADSGVQNSSTPLESGGEKQINHACGDGEIKRFECAWLTGPMTRPSADSEDLPVVPILANGNGQSMITEHLLQQTNAVATRFHFSHKAQAISVK